MEKLPKLSLTFDAVEKAQPRYGGSVKNGRLTPVADAENIAILRCVEWAQFSPDGKTFITGSDDGTARVWSVDYRDTVNYLCSRLLGDFTGAEREQYHIEDTQPTCPGK